MKKKTLTVIIPTWNRARYLEKNLEILDSYLQRGLDFKILVCNNGSTDNTPEVLKKYENHPNVRIINHPENIKYDRNVASGYLNFDTDFCFCLGDSKTLSFESLQKIIQTINEEEIDALVINVHKKMPTEIKYYTNINTMLSEIGWNLTNVSSCIIPKKIISSERCEHYYDSLFIHYGVVIDGLCAKETLSVKYAPDIVKEMITLPDEKQPHGWSSNLINVWVLYWFSFIMSLPWKVSLNTKRKVLYDINKNENYLSPKKFILARINKDKKFIDDYKRNRRMMPFVSNTPLFVYDFISKTPAVFFLLMRPIMKLIPKQRGKLK